MHSHNPQTCQQKRRARAVLRQCRCNFNNRLVPEMHQGKRDGECVFSAIAQIDASLCVQSLRRAVAGWAVTRSFWWSGSSDASFARTGVCVCPTGLRVPEAMPATVLPRRCNTWSEPRARRYWGLSWVGGGTMHDPTTNGLSTRMVFASGTRPCQLRWNQGSKVETVSQPFVLFLMVCDRRLAGYGDTSDCKHSTHCS